MQHYVLEGCSSTRCQGTTFCAARRGGQGRFNTVSEVSPFVPFFSSFPHARKKSSMSRKKNGSEPVKNSVAGVGLLGQSRQSGPGGPGRESEPGPGRAGGGGTCVFLNKNFRRKRPGCRFGAVYPGKKPVFFTGFFPGGGNEVPNRSQMKCDLSEKRVWSDSNRTAQRLQIAGRKCLETMSGVILNRSQSKFVAKSVANEMRCLKAM